MKSQGARSGDLAGHSINSLRLIDLRCPTIDEPKGHNGEEFHLVENITEFHLDICFHQCVILIMSNFSITRFQLDAQNDQVQFDVHNYRNLRIREYKTKYACRLHHIFLQCACEAVFMRHKV